MRLRDSVHAALGWRFLIVIAATAPLHTLSPWSPWSPVVGAQQRAVAPVRQQPSLPPLSMTCPMHPDVVEAKAGPCPLCKMNLVPVRLDVGWTCPLHAVVSEAQPGACRICGRSLVQATVALSWTCRDDEKVVHLEPGLCGDGSPRIGARTLRPHGNHNPKYGGQFFMAPDNWHHLEGTFPRARVFRLYLYDDYARALTPAMLKRVRARVVTKETFDAGTRTTTEIASFPLRPTSDGALEGRIDVVSAPAAMTAKVRFASDAPEYRFDFTFPALTTPPPAARGRSASGSSASRSVRDARGGGSAQPPATAPVTTPVTAPVPSATTVPEGALAAVPVGVAAGASTPTAAPLDALVPVPIPETMGEILAQLRTRHAHVGDLIARGEFGSVWVPAFQAKDLAIALEPHIDRIGAGARDIAEPAIQDVVRSAWRLDAVGDLGNRRQVENAHARFSAAVASLLSAFSGIR